MGKPTTPDTTDSIVAGLAPLNLPPANALQDAYQLVRVTRLRNKWQIRKAYYRGARKLGAPTRVRDLYLLLRGLTAEQAAAICAVLARYSEKLAVPPVSEG